MPKLKIETTKRPTTHAAETAPSSKARYTLREIAFADAITGTEGVTEGATTLRSLFLFLEAQCDSSPIKENAHIPLEERVQAALVVGWDALSTIECGAEQSRELLHKLQAQEPAEVTR